MDNSNYEEVGGESPRRRSKWFTIAISALVLVVLSFGGFAVAVVIDLEQSSVLTPTSMQASAIVALSPEVRVKTAGGTAFSVVEGEVPVDTGWEIQTSSSARALLLLANGTVAVIRENTHLVIEELGAGGYQTRLALVGGAIWSRVERVLTEGQYYEVRSGDIVTSVRGTEFEVARAEEQVTVTVAQSEVAMTSRSAESDSELAKRVVRVASGERITLNEEAFKSEDVDPEELKEVLDSTELETLIRDYGTMERELVDPVIERRTHRSREDTRLHAGALPGSPLYVLERAVEAVGSMAIRENEAKVRRHLALAEERLFEALALAEDGSPEVDRVLSDYQQELSDALSSNEVVHEGDVRELLARATFAHEAVLDKVLMQVPEEARFNVSYARILSQQGHSEAVSALSEVDPEAAFNVVTESMRASLKSAQKESAERNSLSTFDALRRYDHMARLASDIVEREDTSNLRARYVEELRTSLSEVETVATLSPSLLPGIARSVDEVRSRSVKNQIASLAPLVTENPEIATEVYAKTADYYLKRLVRREEAEESEESEEAVETYRSYALFGQEMVSLAQDVRTGETDVRTLVERATSHHVEVLNNARNKLSEKARSTIDRAINAASSIQPKVPAARVIDPKEFKKRHAAERPQEDLDPREFDLPELPTVPPTPTTSSFPRRVMPGDTVRPTVFPTRETSPGVNVPVEQELAPSTMISPELPVTREEEFLSVPSASQDKDPSDEATLDRVKSETSDFLR